MITPFGPVRIALYGAYSYNNMSVILDDGSNFTVCQTDRYWA